LTAGGLLLVPVVLLTTPALPQITATNVAGISYLCLIGGVFTYILWFRGIGHLDPGAVSLLALLSPLAAVVLGWTLKSEALTPSQMAGAVIIVLSVGLGQLKVSLFRRPARVRA
jgi:probable blue pigment (indigoidine) exporter